MKIKLETLWFILKIKTIWNNFFFNLLPDNEKRILILQDTVKHFNAKKIRPKAHHLVIDVRQNGFKPKYDSDVQKVLLSQQKACTVCQRGGILYSMITRLNKFHCDDFEGAIMGTSSEKYVSGGNSLTQLYTEKIFSKLQLALMETAFEGRYNRDFLSDDQYNACCRFYDQYYDEKERFLKIINNALSNNGVFLLAGLDHEHKNYYPL